ncbi:MAG: 7-carboxy-7-deazaguanine synthase QueE [Planctomycetaceae bacterium]|jgi:7-carboxy-7-deazaguanine synthase|nr:7-carboxy-7-deazaguanine synthase QueE [Planctomycetaceae bacterium]
MRIVELFSSKQGEGLWTGTESVFVRVGGCPLRCRFCDTPYASRDLVEGEDLAVEEIVGRVLLSSRRHVVITGGEPMIYAEIIPLTEQLETLGHVITVETAGILELPVRCHLMSISPKLSNSTPVGKPEVLVRRHELNRNRPEIVQKLIKTYPYQLKFVIDTPHDIEEMEAYLSQFAGILPERVLLMPQGVTPQEMLDREAWITSYCLQKGYVYCPRMQIIWYGNQRGT